MSQIGDFLRDEGHAEPGWIALGVMLGAAFLLSALVLGGFEATMGVVR